MFEIRKLNIESNAKIRSQWISVLSQAKIRSEQNLDGVLGVYDGEALVASGAYYQNILKCIAIDEKYQGGAVLAQLVGALLEIVWQQGYTSSYVYTKPNTVSAFHHLGFKEIARVAGQLVFMERAIHGFDAYLEDLGTHRRHGAIQAAIVMNANPFSLGHLYLIETAAKQSDTVYIFVVSEEASIFPSSVRKKLVEQGTSHLNNVVVLDTGNYMVSAQTFPSYFLSENADVTQIQAELDASIFAEKIAPVLGITLRYVGEEPYSVATAIYNAALKKVLEPKIQLKIIPRISVHHEIISASLIRKMIQEHHIVEVRDFVPASTYDFILSKDAESIVMKLQNGGT